MKAMSAVFWSAVACAGIALIMIIVTGISQKKAEQGLPPAQIPVPAVAPPSSSG